MDEVIKTALEFTKLREWLSEQDIDCPMCHSVQMQLVDYIKDREAVHYRCRECGSKSTWSKAYIYREMARDKQAVYTHSTSTSKNVPAK